MMTHCVVLFLTHTRTHTQHTPTSSPVLALSPSLALSLSPFLLSLSLVIRLLRLYTVPFVEKINPGDANGKCQMLPNLQYLYTFTFIYVCMYMFCRIKIIIYNIYKTNVNNVKIKKRGKQPTE